MRAVIMMTGMYLTEAIWGMSLEEVYPVWVCVVGGVTTGIFFIMDIVEWAVNIKDKL